MKKTYHDAGDFLGGPATQAPLLSDVDAAPVTAVPDAGKPDSLESSMLRIANAAIRDAVAEGGISRDWVLRHEGAIKAAFKEAAQCRASS